MQKRLIELHQERGRLLERIAVQRGLLSQQVKPLQGALHWTDRFTGVVGRLKAFAARNPVAVGVAVAAVVVLRPRAVWRWTQRGLAAWRAVRSWRGLGGLRGLSGLGGLGSMLPAFVLDRLRNRR